MMTSGATKSTVTPLVADAALSAFVGSAFLVVFALQTLAVLA